MVFFGVIGPLIVGGGNGQGVPVPAAMQRGVLAVLLARANQVVSRDELAEILWDGRVPPTGRPTLSSYVSRLRRALGPEQGGRIHSRPPGYLLEVAPEEYDVTQLAELERSARLAAGADRWDDASKLAAQGLRLWRGAPYVDVPLPWLHIQSAPAVAATRLRLAELHAVSDLRLGRTEAAVVALTGLVAEHPLQERLHAQLITALTEQGRRADALQAYQRARTILRTELGLDPGPDLVRAQQAVLLAPQPSGRQDETPARPESGVVPNARRPRQLPAPPPHLVGRSAQLAAISDSLASEQHRVCLLIGAGGIGKTALAVTWAHQSVEDYPDGQLYVDLRGCDPSGNPVSPHDAVTGFLYALGVSSPQMPEAFADRAALFRTLVADKRLLVVLDNAADTEQVRELLPGGRDCRVIVTSRNRLAGLVASEGAYPVRLECLSAAESLDFLRHRVGEERAAQAGPQLTELTEACEGSPLALAVLAARLVLEPELSAGDLVARLRDDHGRPAESEIDDAATDLRNEFPWSFQRLSPQTAATFRSLGLVDGRIPALSRSQRSSDGARAAGRPSPCSGSPRRMWHDVPTIPGQRPGPTTPRQPDPSKPAAPNAPAASPLAPWFWLGPGGLGGFPPTGPA